MLGKILDSVDEWVDDRAVDRLAYDFDGAFWLYERDHVFYFTYEHNVICYDHYFSEIPAEDMQYIKDLGADNDNGTIRTQEEDWVIEPRYEALLLSYAGMGGSATGKPGNDEYIW